MIRLLYLTAVTLVVIQGYVTPPAMATKKIRIRMSNTSTRSFSSQLQEQSQSPPSFDARYYSPPGEKVKSDTTLITLGRFVSQAVKDNPEVRTCT